MSGTLMPPVGTPSFMRPPSRSGTWVAVCGEHLDGRELDRLQLDDLADRAVAHHHLKRRGDGRDGERDQEAQAVQAVARPANIPTA